MFDIDRTIGEDRADPQRSGGVGFAWNVFVRGLGVGVGAGGSGTLNPGRGMPRLPEDWAGGEGERERERGGGG